MAGSIPTDAQVVVAVVFFLETKLTGPDLLALGYRCFTCLRLANFPYTNPLPAVP
jgi:hypothetical protein